MIINRVIDNAAVATASLTRAPAVAARAQALAHPYTPGATVFGAAAHAAGQPGVGGLGQRGGRARARLPRHLPRRRVLPPRRQHPADPRRRPAPRRPPRADRRGAGARHRHRLRDPGRPRPRDQPAQAQDRPRRPPRPLRRRGHRHAARPRPGDDLPGRRPGAAHHDGDPAVPQGRDLHLEGATPRPSPARSPSRPSTAPCAARPRPPRSTRARTASSPGCSTAPTPPTRCRCPRPGAPKLAILDTYTKEHSAEYQSQALIDLARKLAPRAPRAGGPGERRLDRHPHQPPHPLRHRLRRERPAEVRPARLPRDARPLDPVHLRRRPAGRRLAPRGLLRPRARRAARTPSRCGARSPRPRTRSGPAATTPTDPAEKAFGGRVEITLTDGRTVVDEIAVADAHPLGARPFGREQYVAQVPHPGRRRARRRRRSSGSSTSPSACPSSAPTSSASSPSPRRPGCWRR